MSEIVVGSRVRSEGGPPGCVFDIRRQTGTPASADLVRFMDGYGAVHEAARGVLEPVDAPDAEVAAQEVARLKDEVAGLEAEMERREKVAREKYEALERDRDYVESAMREASRRAGDAERNLKVVLEREEARIKVVKDRADMWQAATADALAQLKALREAK